LEVLTELKTGSEFDEDPDKYKFLKICGCVKTYTLKNAGLF